ncbi:hypothetical protein L6452_31320 [Arctium lappa]|uniref:Uncharacterized protein n=1 Tax=Arctium lappa TaxID=4217 RepID=A0ACB8ZK50_ARCLA|nr:hypothetical protein L6452_31320 [Arctium lappa]
MGKLDGRGLFNFFDTSNAGYLDYVQIEVGLSALQIPADYKYVKDLLRFCDENWDVRVDYQKFRRYMDDKELELYRIFQAIDVEHNGCILPEELYDALVKAGAFVGCSLEGSMVTTRMQENCRFYGNPSIKTSDILLGLLRRPPAAAILYDALSKMYMKVEGR